MSKMVDLLRQGREEELWQMCCGFVDLSLAQFMAIQRRLLMEQLRLLNKSALGAKLTNGVRPQTVEEFRANLPLTSYIDYCPELLERKEDVLPEKPALWQHSSGRTGEYGCKWVPLTTRYCNQLAKVLLGVAILSGCTGRVISRLKERPKMVYAVAPRPYTSGTLVYILNQEFPLDSMPSLEQSESMSFEERIREGFRQALSRGLDGFCGLSLALEAVGEQFRRRAGSVDILPLLTQPRALVRLTGGLLKSKMAGRTLLPRDLWSIAGIQSGGTDSAVLSERIKELWGRYPLDTYTCTEGAVVATQTWDYSGMTFVPNLNFLEFIPEKEYVKWQLDHTHRPATVLLDEVKAGELYEIVITNFHGGALVRYRIGDMVKIISLSDGETGIETPQMVFERRADDLIDLAGYMRLTERTIWQAIENAGIAYVDWTACKEGGERPLLHLYIELNEGNTASEAEVAEAVYREVKRLDERVNSASIYSTLENMLGRIPIEVNLLAQGAFADYVSQRRAEGADLAHLKPPHINPPASALALLKVGMIVHAKEKAEVELGAGTALTLVDYTTIPLCAGGSYIGGAKCCASYVKIVGTAYAGQPCIVYIEQSQDGTNWDYSLSYQVAANTGVAFEVSVVAPECRLRIVNGPNAQTVLRAYIRGRAS